MPSEIDYLRRRIGEIRAVPHGPKRDFAIKRALQKVEDRIELYKHFIEWPRLIATLEADRDSLVSLKSPSDSVGQSE